MKQGDPGMPSGFPLLQNAEGGESGSCQELFVSIVGSLVFRHKSVFNRFVFYFIESIFFLRISSNNP